MYSSVSQFFAFNVLSSRRLLRNGLLFVVVSLGLLAVSPAARAVDPPPDEGHANQNNTTGDLNIGSGADTLCNMMMLGNTPYGCHTLESNTGRNNTAIGCSALKDNTMGHSNTAIGRSALVDNAMGNNNTAIGFQALSCNIGSDNIALGRLAGTYHMAGNNNIYIGNTGNMATEEGQIRIGTFGLHTGTHIAGIRSAAVSGSPVVIGMDGKLGVTMSSAKFKEAIKPMDKASEVILQLEPVIFRYKQEIDPDGIPQFGLVAEQVEKVNRDLVVRDEGGKVMTVRYEAVNAMLLNEFLKEHSNVQRLEATVGQQQKQIEALTATVQKVSDQVALSKPTRQLVANP